MMMHVQDKLNEKTVAEWKKKDLNWRRAIWLEAAEAVESTPWKWWGNVSLDVKNVKIELIDMWHFAISIAVLKKSFSAENVDAMVQSVFVGNSTGDIGFLISKIEGTAKSALVGDTVEVILESLAVAMREIGMEYEELFSIYMGKSVLNLFRQDHGYKDGTYQKMWNGEEDNVHMLKILGSIEQGNSLEQELYYKLAEVYSDIDKV